MLAGEVVPEQFVAVVAEPFEVVIFQQRPPLPILARWDKDGSALPTIGLLSCRLRFTQPSNVKRHYRYIQYGRTVCNNRAMAVADRFSGPPPPEGPPSGCEWLCWLAWRRCPTVMRDDPLTAEDGRALVGNYSLHPSPSRPEDGTISGAVATVG